MTNTEATRLLTAIEYAYRLGMVEGQNHTSGSTSVRAEEIFEWLFGDEDIDTNELNDDVDETNYDPYIGGDFFEADYNLGEAEEW